MHFVVLGAEDSWYFRELQRAAAGHAEIRSAPFSQIRVEQSGDADKPRVVAGEVRLDNVAAVLVRTMPPGSLEQVVFRMDALAVLAAHDVVVRNPPKAIEAAVDKFLCNALLNRAGLATPPTITCQSYEAAMDAFDRLGRDVVVKPIFGGEGRGMVRVEDEALAHRAFRALTQLGAVIYLQPYLPHESDLRLLRIGERVLAMRRRRRDDWRTNVSQGGKAEAYEPDDALVQLAYAATDAVGADIAGVDILMDDDRGPIILEVNAVPGWRALGRVAGVDVAALVLEHLGELVRGQAANSELFRAAN